MMNFSILKNKELIINSLTLYVSNYQLNLNMYVHVANRILLIKFINVSSFNIQIVSYPIQIECIEIIDNSSRGWSSEVTYHVYDLENDTIDFYCQRVYVEYAEDDNASR